MGINGIVQVAEIEYSEPEFDAERNGKQGQDRQGDHFHHIVEPGGSEQHAVPLGRAYKGQMLFISFDTAGKVFLAELFEQV